ncbi:DUF4244 domain-containing protein [Kribbella sp. NPDC026611]|uniref:DUF4244 domain-containing protein n=1 Tax=Kribbella sp. NPDC026611 TaxID=3154911 RepID=UPI0033EE1BAD
MPTIQLVAPGNHLPPTTHHDHHPGSVPTLPAPALPTPTLRTPAFRTTTLPAHRPELAAQPHQTPLAEPTSHLTPIHRPARRLRDHSTVLALRTRRAAAALRIPTERGAATAEYAVSIVAACGLGGVLIALLRSPAMQNALKALINYALKLAGVEGFQL